MGALGQAGPLKRALAPPLRRAQQLAPLGRCISRCTPLCYDGLMSARVDEVLPTRDARAKLPSLLAGFRARGADADPVVIGAHRRPEAVVLSYERYLAMLSGRERVKAILADRRAAGPGMSEEEAMRVAVQEQHASRR